MKLLPQHLADLRKSGLSDEMIAACGFTSIEGAGLIEDMLCWSGGGSKLGPCLAIPYLKPDGSKSGYGRLKPDQPRQLKKRKIKYESPKDSANKLYFPPGVASTLQDVSVPLILPEGEKKAAAAQQFGFPCIGLSGVWNFTTRGGGYKKAASAKGSKLLDDFGLVAWKGRIVFICFDSDAVSNPSVAGAEWALSRQLASLGAVVKIVRLPPGPPGEDGQPGKVGLDDFLVAHGPDKFSELLALAVDPIKPASKVDASKPREDADDPHRLARLFLEGRRLLYWREDFAEWIDGRWQLIPTKEIEACLIRCIKFEFDRLNLLALEIHKQKSEESDQGNGEAPTARKVTTSLLANVLRALQSLAVLSGSVEPPAWLPGYQSPWPAAEVLPLSNGLLHLPSLVQHKPGACCDPLPDFFSFNTLAYPFDQKAAQPLQWFAFLQTIWPGDQQSIELLQEWFGYCLTLDTRQQKILGLIGPKRSGKGTVSAVLQELLGRENCAGPTLASLGTNFGLWPLLGKTVAIIDDARLSGKTDQAVVTERLLSISGEAAITIDRKHREPITAQLKCRLILLSNELPRLADSSCALPSRFLILKLARSWFGKEDHGLRMKLLTELPGILLWAIAGWERLQQRGHFSQPESGKEMLMDMTELSSPIKTFAEECCQLGPTYSAGKANLFRCWQAWCDEQGRHPGERPTFGRNLKAAFPEIKDGRPRDGETRARVYQGIQLSSEGYTLMAEVDTRRQRSRGRAFD